MIQNTSVLTAVKISTNGRKRRRLLSTNAVIENACAELTISTNFPHLDD
jgi:hypothetical protein